MFQEIHPNSPYFLEYISAVCYVEPGYIYIYIAIGLQRHYENQLWYTYMPFFALLLHIIDIIPHILRVMVDIEKLQQFLIKLILTLTSLVSSEH